MNALLRGKRDWEVWQEHQYRQFLMTSKEGMIKVTARALRGVVSGLSFAFCVLLYVLFKAICAALWLAEALLAETRPNLQLAPGLKRNYHEIYPRVFSRSLHQPFFIERGPAALVHFFDRNVLQTFE